MFMPWITPNAMANQPGVWGSQHRKQAESSNRATAHLSQPVS